MKYDFKANLSQLGLELEAGNLTELESTGAGLGEECGVYAEQAWAAAGSLGLTLFIYTFYLIS